MKKRTKAILGATLGVAVLIQLVPVTRDNPPVSAPVALPDEVRAIVQRSCFDCHSNETQWPWYAYVAPVSWFVAHDVQEGRDHLNFSTDGDLPEAELADLREEIWEEVAEGEMPMPPYLIMHPGARASEEEMETLRAWAGVPEGGDGSSDDDED